MAFSVSGTGRTPASGHARRPVGAYCPARGAGNPLEGRMADEIAPHGDTTDEAQTAQEPAQETDWKAEARKWETRAKENLATAKANEAAAKRLAEFEESQKTEAQKTQERLDAAEKRAAELELKAARAEVAAEKGVPANLLTGATREELEAAADALIQFRGEQPQTRPKPDPNQGNRGSGAVSKGDAFAAFFTSQVGG